jgi:hypothetical protein
VRGQSDPTRMGEALSVEHENIGLTAKLAYGGENRRGLSETEQAGHRLPSRLKAMSAPATSRGGRRSGSVRICPASRF